MFLSSALDDPAAFRKIQMIWIRNRADSAARIAKLLMDYLEAFERRGGDPLAATVRKVDERSAADLFFDDGHARVSGEMRRRARRARQGSRCLDAGGDRRAAGIAT